MLEQVLTLGTAVLIVGVVITLVWKSAGLLLDKQGVPRDKRLDSVAGLILELALLLVLIWIIQLVLSFLFSWILVEPELILPGTALVILLATGIRHLLKHLTNPTQRSLFFIILAALAVAPMCLAALILTLQMLLATVG